MTLAASLPFATETEAQHVAADLSGATLLVVDRHEEIITEFPPLPYTTATLLEDAILAFGWTVSQVMNLAQALFEAGLITYPRTDSVRVAEEAVESGRQVVIDLYGKEALGTSVGETFPLPAREATEIVNGQTHPKRNWRSVVKQWLKSPSPAGEIIPQPDEEDSSDQEAHEAIRPTSPERHPDNIRGMEAESHRLYKLIWTRFIASLMKPARYRMVTVTLEQKP
jgi:DNA topoisomerase I